MTAEELLRWARIGSELVTVIGVPVARVIQLFRESGGTEAQAELLIQHWASLATSIEARIAALKAQTTSPIVMAVRE